MEEKIISKEMIEPLITGGAILGGGRKMARLAFDMGNPRFVDINHLYDEDMVVTVSSVGAPAADNKYVQLFDYVTTINLLKNFMKISPKAIITVCGV